MLFPNPWYDSKDPEEGLGNKPSTIQMFVEAIESFFASK